MKGQANETDWIPTMGDLAKDSPEQEVWMKALPILLELAK
jgi:hypothetical protein